MPKIRRALLSVSDKSGITRLGGALADRGVELVSTGGTARQLREAGLEVLDVSEITGMPEMLDGRVKTLHPNVHGGLLGRLDLDDHVSTMRDHGIESIDLLVCNLYPFEETVARDEASDSEIIEQIDIGGPAMIRSAAKNWASTVVLTDPSDIDELLSEFDDHDGDPTTDFRRRMAGKAFERTASYDRAIADWFGSGSMTLRYGENPHQSASVSADVSRIYSPLHGKELSYNNFVDLSAAAELVMEFDDQAVVIVKHTNPCGVGTDSDQSEAWKKAFATDTKSPFGGIVAFNRSVTLAAAEQIDEIFTEVLIAPAFDDEAFELLTGKKNRRLVRFDVDRLREVIDQDRLRSIPGGILRQSADALLFGENGPQVVTDRAPTEEEWAGLQFAWRVAKHVKSNAIVFAAGDRTLGIGAGQMSRVDSCMIAARKAEIAGLGLAGSSVASDAFFPFADGLLEAVSAGATAVIQPGGSIRDDEVIAAANDNGIAMVVTGMRHFRH